MDMEINPKETIFQDDTLDPLAISLSTFAFQLFYPSGYSHTPLNKKAPRVGLEPTT